MDNASYHSKKDEDETPTYQWKKDRLKKWLDSKKISYPSDAKRGLLYEKARDYAKQNPKYKIDDLIRKFGHTCLRLPPYHCELNPIGY